ncbi:MAG: hypothetical protein AAF611_14610 [Bacteroidota bacterium]
MSFFKYNIKKAKELGLTGTFSGRIIVDKKVFYKRQDVQNEINSLKKSIVIKKQLASGDK